MTHLRMAIPEEPGVAPLYEHLIRQYARKKPDVTVTLEQVTYDTDSQYWDRIWGQRQTHGLPDLIYVHYSWFPGAVASEAFLDLTDRFQAAAYPPDAYFPEASAPFVHRGRFFAVPRETSSAVTYFNATLLRRAGLPLPTELEAEGRWTWEQFRHLAAAVTRSGAGIGAVAPVAVPFALMPVLRSFGCQVHGPAGWDLNGPGVLQAIELLRAMIVEDRSAVLPESANQAAAFGEGRAALMVAGFWHMVVTLPPDPAFAWDVAPIPVGTCRATRTGAGGYAIAAESPAADEAWDLLQWLSQPENTLYLARSGLTIPALRDAAFSPAFLQPGRPPAHRRTFLDALAYGHPDPIVPGWEDVLAALREELAPVWAGQLSPAAALARVQSRVIKHAG